MIRLLSNSLNCEKCLLARLPGMFRLPKSSYNRRLRYPSGGYGHELVAGVSRVRFLVMSSCRCMAQNPPVFFAVRRGVWHHRCRRRYLTGTKMTRSVALSPHVALLCNMNV
ncbi:hypothetical protein TNCV_4420251 [Trichonephila clavipes]|nr:hypothetical protein TNCV_4420251 [Trichonephila clavipes]